MVSGIYFHLDVETKDTAYATLRFPEPIVTLIGTWKDKEQLKELLG